MIESITIKNVATFDPKNGVQITGLKKVNFIYGANGCGKIINKYFVVFEDIFKYTKKDSCEGN